MREKLACIWRYLCAIDWFDRKKDAAKTEQEWLDEQTGGW
jgi:hypothetical protein